MLGGPPVGSPPPPPNRFYQLNRWLYPPIVEAVAVAKLQHIVGSSQHGVVGAEAGRALIPRQHLLWRPAGGSRRQQQRPASSVQLLVAVDRHWPAGEALHPARRVPVEQQPLTTGVGRRRPGPYAGDLLPVGELQARVQQRPASPRRPQVEAAAAREPGAQSGALRYRARRRRLRYDGRVADDVLGGDLELGAGDGVGRLR